MDTKPSDRVLAFDSLFTTNHIQMFKIIFSCMPPSIQGKIAVYIKFLELQHTLNLILHHPSIHFFPCCVPDSTPFSPGLLEEMYPYCQPGEKEQLQNMQNMFQTFENMQQMMEMMDFLKEMAPEMFSADAGSMDVTSFMPSPEGMNMSQITELANMMQEMFSTASKPPSQES